MLSQAPIGDSSASERSRSRRTVLVVDDVRATRVGLAALLRLRGFDALEALNGAEALEVLRADPHICVVILDLWMPGTDGFWFREQQRRDASVADVPIVVFTGSAKGESLAGLDVEDVLLKPFSVDDLLSAIDRACDRGRQAATQ